MNRFAPSSYLVVGSALLLQALFSAAGAAETGSKPQLSPQGDSHTLAASVFDVTPGLSGAWKDPSHTGEGYVLEILSSDEALVYWFTYDKVGNQRWMYGVGAIQGSRILFDELVTTHGGKFGGSFFPVDVVYTTWGTLELDFTSCDSATATYAGPPDFGAGSLNLQRISRIWGENCDGSNADPPGTGIGSLNPGFSGSWRDYTHKGEGFTIEILDEKTALIYWFTYDTQGNQMWMFGVAPITDARIRTNDLLITSGGKFGPDFDPYDVRVYGFGKIGFYFRFCLNHDEGDGANMLYSGNVAPQHRQRLDHLTSIAGLTCRFQ